MPELWQLGAEEIARSVGTGEVAAVEVTRACVARARQVDPAIGAFLEVREEAALAQAARVDARLAAGEPAGPLAGVPIALKDNLSLAGSPTTCGSRILEGYVSPYSATAVERLEAAGAVVLGRTNMDEFGMGSSCENSAFHPTRNPWALDKVPGGSSGGSAAAVAAGAVPLAFGSDTGGSIRQPAALCGVVGVKPTYGRVSRYGLVAFASSLDQIGPLARNVRDSALALRVIAGHDSRDATSAGVPVDDYLADLEQGIAGLRVGLVREVRSGDLGADVRADWDRALGTLTRLGAEVVEVSVPTITAAIAVYYVVATSEASANLARFDGVRYGRRSPSARSLVDLYFASRSEGFGAEVKRRIMLGTFALSAGYYDAYYGRAQAVRERMRRDFSRAFAAADVIAMPTSPTAAFGLGEKADDPLAMYLSDIFTTPASLCGLPAVAAPSGLDARGLPLSLQLIAPPFAEGRALRAARAFERAVGWTVAPALRPSAAA